MSMFRALALAGSLSGVAGAAQAGNLIKGGGFETPRTPQRSFKTYEPGSALGPWTVVGNGDVSTVSTNYTSQGYMFYAKDGLAYLNLVGVCDCGAASGVAQSVATTPNSSYTLSFWIGNTYIRGGAGEACTVNVYNGTTLLISATNRRGSHVDTQVWRHVRVTFSANSTSTSLSFINGDPLGDINCGLDDVKLTASK